MPNDFSNIQLPSRISKDSADDFSNSFMAALGQPNEQLDPQKKKQAQAAALQMMAQGLNVGQNNPQNK